MTTRRRDEILLFCMAVSGLNAAVAACMGNGVLTIIGGIAIVTSAESYRRGLSITKKTHDEPKTN